MILPLYPDGNVPHARDDDDDLPTLTIVRPAHPTGAACVVCPGGGYGVHAPHEREPIGDWLASLGITAALLKYRLGPRYRHPAMLTDALQALRRTRALDGIDPQRVGILGFSAGGHLASTAATLFTGDADRPDFAVLIYPVIQLDGPTAHVGSRINLLGELPDAMLVAQLCTDTAVTARTPPTFLVHSTDDTPVPVENSLRFAAALAAAGVPFGMQIYSQGGHGFGLGSLDAPETLAWPSACAAWLRTQGFLPTP
jgi:acetyl esterase/lipase